MTLIGTSWASQKRHHNPYFAGEDTTALRLRHGRTWVRAQVSRSWTLCSPISSWYPNHSAQSWQGGAAWCLTVGSGLIHGSILIPSHHMLGVPPQQRSWSFWASVSRFLHLWDEDNTRTFLRRLKRELNCIVYAGAWHSVYLILRTQPVWLGKHLFLTHHISMCRDFSYTNIPGLSSHFYSHFPKGEEIYPSVHLEGYFGVCSQPCIRFIQGDSHSLRRCLWLDMLSWSENVLFWAAVLGHPLFPHPSAKCSNLTFISNRVDTLITMFPILTSIAELA